MHKQMWTRTRHTKQVTCSTTSPQNTRIQITCTQQVLHTNTCRHTDCMQYTYNVLTSGTIVHYTHTHAHTCAYTHVHTHMHTHTHTHAHTHVHTHACIHAHTCAHTRYPKEMTNMLCTWVVLGGPLQESS